MLITHLHVQNTLGLRAVDLTPRAPLLLVAGPNGAGKSSLVEALRLALTNAPTRVSLKKEFAALITEGEKAAKVVVEFDGGRASMTLPSGKHALAGAVGPHLPYLLKPEAFAELDDSARRSLLLQLLGVSTEPEDLVARLAQRGCDAAKVAEIAPMLASGFEAAHKAAATRTSEARGAWRAVTGEPYGSHKAVGWAPPAPEPFNAAELAGERAGLDAAEAAIAAAHVTLGARRAAAAQVREQATQRSALQAKADKLGRLRDKLARDGAELAQWTAKLAELPAPGSAPVRPPLTCPDCGASLVVAGGQLAHPATPTSDDAHTARARTEWGEAAALYERSVANDQRDLAEAEAAAAALAALGEPVSAPSAADLAAVEGELAPLTARRARHHEAVRVLEAQQRDAALAAQRSHDATRHHHDVEQWAAIAEALSPDGLPAQLVADALTPFNAKLAEYALGVQWSAPHVGADMVIRAFGSRPWALCSKSEQWRINALLAAAIAHCSGERFVVLDGFDILEVGARADLLYWLSDLVGAGELGQALVLGTLKALPAELPEHFAGLWLDPAGARARLAA